MAERLKYNREYYLKNKDKIVESSKKWSRNNRSRINKKRNELRKKYGYQNYDYNWGNQLKKRFGITKEEYNIILLKQEKKCAICLNDKYYKRLSVDHNHETGEIRGLLCNNCNLGIGYLKENINYLENSIKYIIKYGK